MYKEPTQGQSHTGAMQSYYPKFSVINIVIMAHQAQRYNICSLQGDCQVTSYNSSGSCFKRRILLNLHLQRSGKKQIVYMEILVTAYFFWKSCISINLLFKSQTMFGNPELWLLWTANCRQRTEQNVCIPFIFLYTFINLHLSIDKCLTVTTVLSLLYCHTVLPPALSTPAKINVKICTGPN